jgi:hypothetical protein
MRRMALFLLLIGCFPDADKLRTKGAGPGPGPQGGGGGVIGIGGNTAGSGGAPGGAGGGGTGGMTTANRAQLCNQFAEATADKATECAPFVQAFRYGSRDAQAARIRLNCNLYDLPSVLFPPSPFQDCAAALAAQSCSDWIDGAIPSACAQSGSLGLGATCTSGYQCASDLCDIPATGCGKCNTLPGDGEPCYRGFCDAGLVCNPSGNCVTPGGAGAACSADSPCAESLACHGGTCGERGGVGAPCASNGECDIYQGTICAMNTKCVPVVTGSMCTVRPDGTYVFCAAGATCQMDGSCLPAAADGAACNMTNGPDCVWPAECLSDMKCHLFQPNRSCQGTAAARAPGPGVGLLPGEAGVRAFWRSLVTRPLAPTAQRAAQEVLTVRGVSRSK